MWTHREDRSLSLLGRLKSDVSISRPAPNSASWRNALPSNIPTPTRASRLAHTRKNPRGLILIQTIRWQGWPSLRRVGWVGASGSVLQHRQRIAGARHRASKRNGHSRGAGSWSRPVGSAASDRKPAAGGSGWWRGTVLGTLGGGFSQFAPSGHGLADHLRLSAGRSRVFLCHGRGACDWHGRGDHPGIASGAQRCELGPARGWSRVFGRAGPELGAQHARRCAVSRLHAPADRCGPLLAQPEQGGKDLPRLQSRSHTPRNSRRATRRL